MTVTVPDPAGTKPGARRTIEKPRPATTPEPTERRAGRTRSAAAERAYG